MAEGALHWFWGFVSEWKSGNKAELKLFCEDGRLRVNMSADMGPFATPPVNFWDPNGLNKASPSRLRRNERRAAARTEAEKAVARAEAEKAAGRVEAEKATAKAKAEKASADCVSAAEKHAAEKAASGEAAAAMRIAEEKAAAAKVDAKSNVEEKVSVDSIATTSTCGNNVMLGTATKCGNCEGLMCPDHQCDSTSPASEVELAPAPLPLCLYCCHQGSGDHPVHFFQRCLCEERVCVCQCYCTESQVEVKRKHFTHRDWEVTLLSAEKRAAAHAFASAQGNKFYCSYNGCTSTTCSD